MLHTVCRACCLYVRPYARTYRIVSIVGWRHSKICSYRAHVCMMKAHAGSCPFASSAPLAALMISILSRGIDTAIFLVFLHDSEFALSIKNLRCHFPDRTLEPPSLSKAPDNIVLLPRANSTTLTSSPAIGGGAERGTRSRSVSVVVNGPGARTAGASTSGAVSPSSSEAAPSRNMGFVIFSGFFTFIGLVTLRIGLAVIAAAACFSRFGKKRFIGATRPVHCAPPSPWGLRRCHVLLGSGSPAGWLVMAHVAASKRRGCRRRLRTTVASVRYSYARYARSSAYCLPAAACRAAVQLATSRVSSPTTRVYLLDYIVRY
jgi:hypothetical protein